MVENPGTDVPFIVDYSGEKKKFVTQTEYKHPPVILGYPEFGHWEAKGSHTCSWLSKFSLRVMGKWRSISAEDP